jgi:hypothetical protein
MELVWAERAGKHAETYWGLLQIVKDKKKLRLTKYTYQHSLIYVIILVVSYQLTCLINRLDDELYNDFRKTFPTFKVDNIDEKKFKDEKSKKKWRPFCMRYENSDVVDYNFATLLRLHCRRDYSSDNSVVGNFDISSNS